MRVCHALILRASLRRFASCSLLIIRRLWTTLRASRFALATSTNSHHTQTAQLIPQVRRRSIVATSLRYSQNLDRFAASALLACSLRSTPSLDGRYTRTCSNADKFKNGGTMFAIAHLPARSRRRQKQMHSRPAPRRVASPHPDSRFVLVAFAPALRV